MTQNRRLVLNILATNGRTVYTIACGLLTGRWMMQALGAQDYGLLGLVGGLIAFMSVFNVVFSASISRYYAFSISSIGEKTRPEDVENCRQWFNAAVAIHLALPIIIFSAGYPIGSWAVTSWLTIPADRVNDCLWVFRLSCISCLVGMFSVPFRAMYVAKQEIAELTVYSAVTTTLNVCVLYYMVIHPSDWLVMMAVWLMLMVVVPALIISVRAWIIFQECSFNRHYFGDKVHVKQLLGFAGWQFFSNFGNMLREQGDAIIVNKFLGPIYNATKTVSGTVSGHAQIFANEVNSAFLPAITNACGTGNLQLMQKLVWQSSLFSGFLVLVIIIPLTLEMPFLMELWLGAPPPFCAELCICVCWACLLNKFTCGLWMAITAYGKVGKINIADFLCYISTPCIFFVGMCCGRDVRFLGQATLVSWVLSCVCRLALAQAQANVKALDWCKRVFVPLVIVSASGLSAGALVRCLMTPSFFRVVSVGIFAEVAIFCSAWFFAFDKDERDWVMARLSRALRVRR